jgi:nicotinamidase-related amidase
MQSIHDSALIVIDVQDSFRVTDRWNRRNNPNFEENIATLIAAYRDAGLPIIFVLHSDADGDEWQTGSPHYKVMDFVPILSSDTLLHKTTRNAFTSTDLGRRLTEAGIRRLVIAGIQTEQCCETTARVGADMGYDIDFVTEATLTFPIQREPGNWSSALSADAVVERTEFALRGRFARIATVNDILEQLDNARACRA